MTTALFDPFKSRSDHYSSQLSQLTLRHSACAYDSLCQEAPRLEPLLEGGLLDARRRCLHRRGPLFSSPRSPRTPSKRSRSKSTSRTSPRAKRGVDFAKGEDDSRRRVSNGSDIDRPGHIGGSRDDTAGAARSSGDGGAPELSLELIDSLKRVDDPVMQHLGSFLSATAAETAELRKRLAASEERARIN